MIDSTRLSRRALLRSSGLLAGSALVTRVVPFDLWAQAAAQVSAVDARRNETAKAPIVRSTLGDRLALLAGPGGNVVVLHGPDGLLLVDNFVRPAWAPLKKVLDGIGPKILHAIDTHWHFDHADNNANLRRAGAAIVAHANTKKRLSQSHDVLGMHFDPEPAEALPTVVFTDMHAITANGETVTLRYVPPAHTDTDVTVRFDKGNVLHMGDLFFNGMYPFIDASTGGNIKGMVAAADKALGLVDASTKIVPGHGPLADKAALQRYRAMLADVRDAIGKLKTSGKTQAETIAAKPTKALDAVWGNGFMKPDDFVGIVYGTL
jgi:cyclase